MPAIEIKGLTKDFLIGFWRKHPVRALDNLDLNVEQGEVFGFLGPNGAGKTTTLKILMSLLRPTSGSASILGEPIDAVSMHARIGYLPENPYFYDYLTAREFLTYVGRLFGIRQPALSRKVGELLENVGLGPSGGIQLRKYSKGMIQRVGIAQALVNDPEVVFLDEPMSGLDPLGRREVRQVVASLKSKGVTVFFSSHILPDVEALCDRVAIMNRGRLRAIGALNEILKMRIEGHEIILTGASAQMTRALSGMCEQMTALGERLILRAVSPAQVASILESISSGGAELLSVSPIRPSLEDYFFEEIAGGRLMRILAIAHNTFRENIRDKVLYNLILFALIMILSSTALGQLTLGHEDKVIVDLGLTCISVFGTLIAIFIGISLVHKEIEKRTVYAMLSKPVRRAKFIAGKFLGLLFTLLLNTIIVAAGLVLTLMWHGGAGLSGYLRLLPAVYLIFLSLSLTTALALLFSTFSTPALSALFTFFLWVIGHFNFDLRAFGHLGKSRALQSICNALYYLLPNFANFELIGSRNVIQSAAYYQPIDAAAVGWVSVYCALYSAILLGIAAAVFSRRDFK